MPKIVLLLFTFLIGIVNITSGYHVTRLQLFDLCTSAKQISISDDEIVVLKIQKYGNGLPENYNTCSVQVQICDTCDSGLYYSFNNFRVGNHNVRVKVETVTPNDGTPKAIQFGDFMEPVPRFERFANSNATLTFSWLSIYDDDFMIEVQFYTGNFDLLLLYDTYEDGETMLWYFFLGIVIALLICMFLIIRACYGQCGNDSSPYKLTRSIKRYSPLSRRRQLLP